MKSLTLLVKKFNLLNCRNATSNLNIFRPFSSSSNPSVTPLDPHATSPNQVTQSMDGHREGLLPQTFAADEGNNFAAAQHSSSLRESLAQSTNFRLEPLQISDEDVLLPRPPVFSRTQADGTVVQDFLGTINRSPSFVGRNENSLSREAVEQTIVYPFENPQYARSPSPSPAAFSSPPDDGGTYIQRFSDILPDVSWYERVADQNTRVGERAPVRIDALNFTAPKTDGSNLEPATSSGVNINQLEELKRLSSQILSESSSPAAISGPPNDGGTYIQRFSDILPGVSWYERIDDQNTRVGERAPVRTDVPNFTAPKLDGSSLEPATSSGVNINQLEELKRLSSQILSESSRPTVSRRSGSVKHEMFLREFRPDDVVQPGVEKLSGGKNENLITIYRPKPFSRDHLYSQTPTPEPLKTDVSNLEPATSSGVNVVEEVQTPVLQTVGDLSKPLSPKSFIPDSVKHEMFLREVRPNEVARTAVEKFYGGTGDNKFVLYRPKPFSRNNLYSQTPTPEPIKTDVSNLEPATSSGVNTNVTEVKRSVLQVLTDLQSFSTDSTPSPLVTPILRNNNMASNIAASLQSPAMRHADSTNLGSKPTWPSGTYVYPPQKPTILPEEPSEMVKYIYKVRHWSDLIRDWNKILRFELDHLEMALYQTRCVQPVSSKTELAVTKYIEQNINLNSVQQITTQTSLNYNWIIITIVILVLFGLLIFFFRKKITLHIKKKFTFVNLLLDYVKAFFNHK